MECANLIPSLRFSGGWVRRSAEHARDARAIAKTVSPVKGPDTLNKRSVIFTRAQRVTSGDPLTTRHVDHAYDLRLCLTVSPFSITLSEIHVYATFRDGVDRLDLGT